MVDIKEKHITIKILEDSVKRKSMLTLGLVMGVYMWHQKHKPQKKK